MENWTDVAKEVPSLAILIALVLYFFRYLERVGERHETRLEQIAQSHKSEMRSLLERYSRVAEQGAQVAMDVKVVMQRVLDRLDAKGS